MKEVLTYIFGVVACSGLFVLFYRLVLHRNGGEGSFRTARIFLPVSLAASAVIPALKIPVWPSAAVEIPFIMQALPMAETPLPAAAPTVDVLQIVLWTLYGLGITVLAGVMVWQAAKIARIRRRAEIHNMERCTVAVSEEVSAPFSFLATVYIGRETSPDEMRQIVLHESSHIRHRHSVEKIIMETLKALQWFNPFAWWASRLLVEVHEFEADRDVLRGGYTVEEYLPVIFRQIFGYIPEISTGLGNSLTKKRLQMMKKSMKQSRLGWLRAAGVLPLAAGMLALFSFTSRTPEIIMTGAPEVVEQAPEPAAQKPEVPVYIAEDMPVFQNGDLNTFRNWVMERLVYPKEAAEKKIVGKVVAKFVIEKDGSISNVEIIDSPDKSLSDEVVRVIGLSPAWTPGKQKDKPVRVYYILPVDFSLRGEGAGGGNKPAEKPAIRDVKVIGYGAQQKEDGGESGTVTNSFKVNGIWRMDGKSDGQPLFWLANEKREMSEEEIKSLDANTIKSIDVLKGASATQLYGEAGKNGVIVIKLKGEGEDKELNISNYKILTGKVARITTSGEDGIYGATRHYPADFSNSFIWLDREKKALTPEEFKNLDPATVEDITVGKTGSGWVFENLPRKAKAAMRDKEYDSVIVVTTKK